MKRILVLALVLVAGSWFLGCAAKTKDITAQLDAAKKAIADAKGAAADKLCPEEFQSAELKLKQALLLDADGDKDQAEQAAIQSAGLADVAKKCAFAKQAHTGETPLPVGMPPELKNFKASVYFDFNSNAIAAGERAKLDKAVEFLTKAAKDHRFYVLLTSYADAPGTPDANMELSKRRAVVVRYYLSNAGLIRSRVYMQAMGETMSGKAGALDKAYNKKDPEWRRVDITVLLDRPTTAITEGRELE
jgi:outer membrane protein OmpA-like peptidoglycan-associated protein